MLFTLAVFTNRTKHAAGRVQGLFVERVYGSVAPRRIVAGSQAHWSGSFADLLAAIGVPDWRLAHEYSAAIRFKSGIASGAHTHCF